MQNHRTTNLTGLQGGQVITDTATYTPPTGEAWHAIQVIEQAVISAITTNLTTSANLVAVTLPAGLVIYGRCTSLKLTSGKVIAYQA